MAPPLKTHCKYGHEYTPENTHSWRTKTGYIQRKCKACRRQADYDRYRDKPQRKERQQHLNRCRYHGVEPIPYAEWVQ